MFPERQKYSLRISLACLVIILGIFGQVGLAHADFVPPDGDPPSLPSGTTGSVL